MTLLLKKQGICVKKEELLRKTFLIYNSEIQESELYGEKRSEKKKNKIILIFCLKNNLKKKKKKKTRWENKEAERWF